MYSLPLALVQTSAQRNDTLREGFVSVHFKMGVMCVLMEGGDSLICHISSDG